MTACVYAVAGVPCGSDAGSVLRMLPRRTDTPCCDLIRRAIVWPNVELPIDVPACARNLEAVRLAARTVLAETVADGDVVTRKVEG